MATRKKEIPIDSGKSEGSKVKSAGKAGSASQTAVGAESEPEAGAQAESTEGMPAAAAPEGELESLTEERDELADSLLRLRAEFDNYRKRAARELTDARVCAQGDLLTELLPVLDNLERALDAAEHHEEGKVLKGVRMTRDLFVGLLERTGVEEIPGVGTEFDPEFHDACQVQPSEMDEGVVTMVLERGYRQGEQVLRPARVVVSAGPDGEVAAGSRGGADDAADPGSGSAE
jgi:molecular chaperone GrpE